MSGLDNTSQTVRVVAASATGITINANDYVIVVTGGATAQAVSIPSGATVIPGREYTVINASGGTTTITPAAGTINGGASLALTTGTSATVIADGSTATWWIKSEGTVA